MCTTLCGRIGSSTRTDNTTPEQAQAPTHNHGALDVIYHPKASKMDGAPDVTLHAFLSCGLFFVPNLCAIPGLVHLTLGR
jgi:hypothetical protein